MKLFGILFAGMVLSSGVAFAEHHGTCTGKDGKAIEAKDEADCKAKGGEFKKAEATEKKGH